jgi:divalent metal cation (Fe/Co/Zn/Cd) transporter
VAALVVAVIVVYVSLQLGRRAVAVLLDAAPPGLVERIASEVGGVTGIQGIGPVRVRQAGAATFVDLTVDVDRSTSLEEAHRIATQVESQIGALLHVGDVVVHVDPVRRAGESLPQTVHAIAGRLGLRAHNIHAHEVRGRYYVDLHAEVPPSLTLAEAHERVSRLEAALCEELPHVSDVQTHIEPLSVPVALADEGPDVGDRLRAQIVAVVDGIRGLHSCHDLHLRPGPDGYDVVVHCLADPELPVAEAHHLAEEVERRLRAEVTGISQVLVHVEPEEKGELQE